MKNLLNKIVKKAILPFLIAGSFAFNSYAQRVEKTENGFKEFNEFDQLIRKVVVDSNITKRVDYWYDEKGREIMYKLQEDKKEGDTIKSSVMVEHYTPSPFDPEILIERKTENEKEIKMRKSKYYKYGDQWRKVYGMEEKYDKTTGKTNVEIYQTIFNSDGEQVDRRTLYDYNNDGIIDKITPY